LYKKDYWKWLIYLRQTRNCFICSKTIIFIIFNRWTCKKKGSQFIISTHSPILISYRNGNILDLNDNFKEISYKVADIYKLYKMYLDNPDNSLDRLFNS